MKANALVYMVDGRRAETETTRAALADFWQRRESDILAAVIDVNLTRWFYHRDHGWERGTLFRYTPNHPESWRQDKPTTRPTTATPFDRI